MHQVDEQLVLRLEMSLSKWSEPLFTLDGLLQFCCKRCKSICPSETATICMDDATRRGTMKTRLVPAVFLSDCLANTRKIPVDFLQRETKKRERERNLKERSKNGTRLYVALWPSSSFIIPLPVNHPPNREMESTLEKTVPKKRASRRDVISQLSDFTFQRRLQRE